MTEDIEMTALDGYEGVVYDLDGTIVRLVVDWEAVQRDVEAVFENAGVDPDGDLWDLMARGPEHGIGPDVEETIARHEREGANRSRRLPLADELAALDRPAAICSLNCEAACRIALDVHGLDEAVDAVVGRDTVEGMKPSPGPLHAALDGIGVDPADAVFVGDSKSDEQAAAAAGLDFQWVTEGRREERQ